MFHKVIVINHKDQARLVQCILHLLLTLRLLTKKLLREKILIRGNSLCVAFIYYGTAKKIQFQITVDYENNRMSRHCGVTTCKQKAR